jgi:hypothetical protein
MRAITTPLYLLAAIPILGALVVLGWINSSPRRPRIVLGAVNDDDPAPGLFAGPEMWVFWMVLVAAGVAVAIFVSWLCGGG